MSIMRPHVNNNGTSRSALVLQRVETRRRLADAIQAHHELAPHGRDYQGGGSFETDLTVWRARHIMLETMYRELEEEALFIHNQEY